MPCFAGVAALKVPLDLRNPDETQQRTGKSPARLPPGQKPGKRFEHAVKRIFHAVLDRIWPAGPSREIPEATSVRAILFVRPNFRMGNIILSTALLAVLRARYPRAQIDFLVGDNTARLLEGLPIGRVHVISRGFVRAPWKFVALFRRLRRTGYDLAVDGGMGSFSGALYAWLSGARESLGREGSADRFLSVRLRFGPLANSYETAPAVARALGVTCDAWPVYRVSEIERAEAENTLADFGLRVGGQEKPFVGIFPGGHRDKRWPRANWLELIERLAQAGTATVVFLGPEEMNLLPELRTSKFNGVHVVLPGMRRTAGILAYASLLVTPDSGPMHLAAALHVPIVAIILTAWSHSFVPPGVESRICRGTSAAEVHAALREHPAWTSQTRLQAKSTGH